jgi:catechol 2,3-dioxygenase-like lactoylglutathione lyase family enzyme
MGIQRLAIVSIPVSDQQRARDFYTNTLGFALVRDAPFRYNTRWIEVTPADGQPSFTLVTWFVSMPAGSLRPGAARRQPRRQMRQPEESRVIHARGAIGPVGTLRNFQRSRRKRLGIAGGEA